MNFSPKDPPRPFRVGLPGQQFELKDCGRMELAPDEQVTFTTPAGGEFDVARKSWGFYATPSLNGRLQGFGLRAVLVKNLEAKYYLLLVERGKESDFEAYLVREKQTIVCWLDDSARLETLERSLSRP